MVASANANTVMFETPSGASSGGEPVDASATFVTSANTLTITLVNVEANPTDVTQLISDLSFSLTSGQTSGTLVPGSGLQRSVATGGAFTDSTVPDLGWDLSGLALTVLGTPIGPAHLIIGPPNGSNKYSNADPTIAGNALNNPFLAGPILFTIHISGLTGADTVNSTSFSFGTTEGAHLVQGVRVPDNATTLLLLGLAICVLWLFRRKLT